MRIKIQIINTIRFMPNHSKQDYTVTNKNYNNNYSNLMACITLSQNISHKIF